MTIDNEGKLGTEKVEGSFGVTLISLPTNQIIETLPGFKFGTIPLFPDNDRQDVVYQIAFRIPDFERHKGSIERLREAFVVKGTFIYDDGLGEQITDASPCQQVVPQVNTPLVYSFVDCGRVPEFLSTWKQKHKG